MPSNKPYIRKDDIWAYQKFKYNEDYTEEMDKEGLKILRWSMFDSPDVLGSGKRFMETEPVAILDRVYLEQRVKGYILLGYTSKTYADRIALPSDSSHRIGKGVKLKCLNRVKRLKIVRGLIQYGVERIHLYKDSIYFDTDNYIKKPELLFFS